MRLRFKVGVGIGSHCSFAEEKQRERERERELVKWIVGAGMGLVVLGFLLASPWVLSVVHSKTCQLVYTWFELRSDE